MWLSSISKRTPKAYFLYILFDACLLLIASGNDFFGSGWSPFRFGHLKFLLPGLLVLLLSFLVNRIYVLSDVFDSNTLWPGHAFILISVTVGLDAPWLGIVIHGLGSILILNEMLNVHYNRDTRLAAFNIAFCIGIASFFEPTLILMAPFLLLGLRLLKPLNLKEYIIYLIGLSCPYYFLWAYSFLSNDYSHWSGIFPVAEWFQPPVDLELFMWVRWGLALFLILVALGLVFINFDSFGVRSRRMSLAVTYMLAGSLVALLAGGGQHVVIFYMAAAFAFPATLLMLRYSNKPFLELMHIIFVGIILAALLAGNI